MKNLSYLDAAEHVLHEEGRALHYRVITERAIEHGLKPGGATPARTLTAVVGLDIAQRKERGEAQRFVRLAPPGYIGIAKWQPQGFTSESEDHNQKVRDELLKRALAGDPKEFESLIETLLVKMGFDKVKVTRYRKDGGLDVLGTLVVDGMMHIDLAVQVKRWKRNVQAPVVRALRGSLAKRRIGHGMIVTTSGFSKGAKEEARDSSYPIDLVNGEKLARLLATHEIGVEHEVKGEHTLFRLLDPESDDAD